MKAIRIEHYGGPEVLSYQDIEIPTPGEGDVLVKVANAGINFMDIHTRQGKYAHSRTYPLRLPLTLGMEGAGTVASVGHGVSSVRADDRVAWCIAWGSYAEFAVIPEKRLAKVPASIPLDLAAAAMFQGCTAHYLSHDVGRLGPGRTCLILAASGGIGQLLIQFAKRAGATVYAVASSPSKAEIARQRGADVVFDYERFADEVRRATHGNGVDVVFDPVGSTTLRDSLRAARKKGLIVNFGSVAGSLRDLDPIELGEAGSLFLTRPRLADYMADMATVRRRAEDLFAGLTDGSLSVSITSRYAFGDVARAHAQLELRRHIGKSILVIQEKWPLSSQTDAAWRAHSEPPSSQPPLPTSY